MTRDEIRKEAEKYADEMAAGSVEFGLTKSRYYIGYVTGYLAGARKMNEEAAAALHSPRPKHHLDVWLNMMAEKIRAMLPTEDEK